MLRTLNVDYKQSSISILNIKNPYNLFFVDGKSASINQENGKRYIAGCINCMRPRCMKLDECEIKCESFSEMSSDMNLSVCPVGAIEIGLNRININHTKCIGCGLCIQRCPIGALHFKEGKVIHNETPNAPRIELPVTDKNIRRQEEFIDSVIRINHSGEIRRENDVVMTDIYDKIKKMSQEQQNILIRNIMISLGASTTLSRHGNVYLRMDGFYETVAQYGVIEIEAGLDMLDVSRALLDDVAVLHTRYNIKKEDNHPLAVCLGLPNKRTDYWQVLKDILRITNLKINTVTFGVLLILLWNLEELNDYDMFYIDVDDSSLRNSVENFLERKVHISRGYLGILENAK